jgi:hypothetical protein
MYNRKRRLEAFSSGLCVRCLHPNDRSLSGLKVCSTCVEKLSGQCISR